MIQVESLQPRLVCNITSTTKQGDKQQKCARTVHKEVAQLVICKYNPRSLLEIAANSNYTCLRYTFVVSKQCQYSTRELYLATHYLLHNQLSTLPGIFHFRVRQRTRLKLLISKFLSNDFKQRSSYYRQHSICFNTKELYNIS